MVNDKEKPIPQPTPKQLALFAKIAADHAKEFYDRGWKDGFEAGLKYPRLEPND